MKNNLVTTNFRNWSPFGLEPQQSQGITLSEGLRNFGLKQTQLGQLLGDEHEVWQVTKPTPEASKRLKLMGIRAPEPILKLV